MAGLGAGAAYVGPGSLTLTGAATGVAVTGCTADFTSTDTDATGTTANGLISIFSSSGFGTMPVNWHKRTKVNSTNRRLLRLAL